MHSSIVHVLFMSCRSLVDANVFLGRPQFQSATSMLNADSERMLLSELEVALGKGHRHATEKRLKRIEQMLAPMFGAMVKNEHGKLGPSAAGYMLHRIFVKRHGWFIKALEPANGSFAAWNTSTPTSVLEERVPQHVTELFESRLGQHGLGVKDLAILASSLEHLVHLEALHRLNVSYQGASFSQGTELSAEEAMQVLEMYMAIYILGFIHYDLASMTGDMAHYLHENILELYPTWPETQQFLREVYQSVAPSRDYLYYTDVENVIGEIGERYGRFQDIECRQLKDWLLEVEDTSVGGAGRVRLSDFYGKALNDGKWQFSESASYLRELGALDESDPSNLRVIIPNYLSAPSNCVASSAYYSVCCLDECESILASLEEKIAAPHASPEVIIETVSTIASATVSNNRAIAPWLRTRLHEVAAHHGGYVPLHGRLFAQWLHYAYPRECQFPHVAGTINPQRPEDILAASDNPQRPNETINDIAVTEEQMKQTISEALPPKKRTPGAEIDIAEESGMWRLDEELVVWHVPAETVAQKPSSGYGLREAVFFGVVVSFSVAIFQRRHSPDLEHLHKGSSDRYFV